MPTSVAEATPPQSLDPGPVQKRYLGVVLATEAVDVVAEIDGQLEQVAVRVGDAVSRGQRIATLDTRDLRHEQRIERTNLATAEARQRQIVLESERAEQEHHRRSALEDLLSKEEIAGSAFDRDSARLRLEVATAEVDQVKARLAHLSTQLERSEIRAPFDGRVALRYLDAGAVATAGTPVVRLIASARLRVRFAVPPEEIAGFAVGQRMQVEIETPPCIRRAIVEHIAPEIDSASQMVFIEARFEPQAADLGAPELPAGAVARLSLASSE